MPVPSEVAALFSYDASLDDTNNTRRSACDRCRGQKLRCRRLTLAETFGQLDISHLDIRHLHPSCLRCIKAGATCTTIPQQTRTSDQSLDSSRRPKRVSISMTDEERGRSYSARQSAQVPRIKRARNNLARSKDVIGSNTPSATSRGPQSLFPLSRESLALRRGHLPGLERMDTVGHVVDDFQFPHGEYSATSHRQQQQDAQQGKDLHVGGQIPPVKSTSTSTSTSTQSHQSDCDTTTSSLRWTAAHSKHGGLGPGLPLPPSMVYDSNCSSVGDEINEDSWLHCVDQPWSMDALPGQMSDESWTNILHNNGDGVESPAGTSIAAVAVVSPSAKPTTPGVPDGTTMMEIDSSLSKDHFLVRAAELSMSLARLVGDLRQSGKECLGSTENAKSVLQETLRQSRVLIDILTEINRQHEPFRSSGEQKDLRTTSSYIDEPTDTNSNAHPHFDPLSSFTFEHDRSGSIVALHLMTAYITVMKLYRIILTFIQDALASRNLDVRIERLASLPHVRIEGLELGSEDQGIGEDLHLRVYLLTHTFAHLACQMHRKLENLWGVRYHDDTQSKPQGPFGFSSVHDQSNGKPDGVTMAYASIRVMCASIIKSIENG